MSETAYQRLQQLDLLRSLAVLFVMIRHMRPCPAETDPFLHAVTEIGIRGTFVAVDMFFVLSGFLVSSLIFREYKRKGSADIKKFLIRRSLKIYPAFWVLLIATLVTYTLRETPYDPWAAWGEILFLQNYLGGIWGQTWTLAIEEHFYIVLAILFYFFLRYKKEDPFSAIPAIFIGLAVFCFLLRLYVTATQEYSFATHLIPTHLRIDSLFFGVLISYYWSFGNLAENQFLQRNRMWLAVAGTLLFLPAFIFEVKTTPWLTPAGLTLFYLGGGCWLLFFLKSDFSSFKFLRPISYVAIFSYSIYLWHVPIEMWGTAVLRRFLPVDNWFVYVTAYFTVSIVFGIFMSKLVEYPFIKLRDKLYPSKVDPLKDQSGPGAKLETATG